MASPVLYTNPQGLPNRLPRLSYRTKSCDTKSVSSASTTLTTSALSTAPTSPFSSNFCPSPRSPPSEMSLPSSPRQASFSASSQSSKSSSNLPKKRSNFFSSLFNVKEPSAQALQDYQRQLMKQNGGRVTAVGIPGVSSAKLPATVPKVNSKWDGVPQILKEKEKQQDADGPSMSGLSRQLGTSGSGTSEHKATSTANSSRKRLSRGTLGGASVQSGSSNNLAGLYGWETSSHHSESSAIDFVTEHRPTTALTAPSLHQKSSFPPRDTAQPPSMPYPPTELAPPSYSDAHDPPALSYSPMLTPCDSSPATPDAPSPSPFRHFTSPISEASPQENAKTTPLEASGSAEEVIVKSAGVNILGPPAAAKRKPRPTPLQSSHQRPNTSAGVLQSNSVFCEEVAVQNDTPSLRPSPGSYFPSTVTTPKSDSPLKEPIRRNSTHERLGLGMNFKRPMVAPWQSPERATDVNAEDERIITPTPEGGQSLKRKSRRNLFKK